MYLRRSGVLILTQFATTDYVTPVAGWLRDVNAFSGVILVLLSR